MAGDIANVMSVVGCIPEVAVRLEQLTFDRLTEGYPNIATWFDVVKARPSYAEAIDGWSSKAHVENNLKHGAIAWETVKVLFDDAA